MNIQIDALASEVAKIYQEYGQAVDDALNDVLEELAKEGRQKVRDNSRGYGWSSKQINGWQYQVKHERTGPQAVIFHGTRPGLPHLLEVSHIVKYPHGNRRARSAMSTAKPHVKSVEAELEGQLVARLRSRLS